MKNTPRIFALLLRFILLPALMVLPLVLPLEAYAAVDPICFTAEENGTSIKLLFSDYSGIKPQKIELEYKKESDDWKKYTWTTIVLNKGEKLQFRRSSTDKVAGFSSSYNNYWYQFEIKTGRAFVSGNVKSLLRSNDVVVAGVFMSLFSKCTGLTSAEKLILPTDTINTDCYQNMFHDCINMVAPPNLPATVLKYSCYYMMFSGCTNLATAPQLPATTMESMCYSYMFKDCKSLKDAPKLPARNLNSYCYEEMFSGCTNLINTPELPATKLYWGCYRRMFSGCTSLTSIPKLPATDLNVEVYREMFQGCSNIKLYYGYGCSEWSIPSGGFAGDSWGKDMLTGTGGIITGQPIPGQIYYQRSSHQFGTEGDARFTCQVDGYIDNNRKSKAELEDVKNNAITELNSYKDASLYREKQKTELATAISNGTTAINAATTVEGVNSALTAAKAAIDAIKTDAQLTAEEQVTALANAKTTAITALNNYKDANDYRDAQKTELANAISNGTTAINAATTVEGVNSALAAAKAAINAIKTDAQLTAEEQATALVDAKSEAITALNNYKNAADYRDAQKTELANAISDGTTAINAATTVEGVNSALAAAKAALDAIKTDAQLTAEEQAKALADAKSNAITALNNYKNASDYRDAQKTELSNAITSGTAAINAATTVDGVNSALTAAKATIDAIKTDAQLTAEEQAKALADAKNAAITALNNYKNAADYRDAQKTELSNAVSNGTTAINAATTVDGVNSALTAAKNAIDAIKTDAQLTAEEKDAALAAAKQEAISALNSYKDAGDYRDAQKTELTNAINNGIAAINAATTIEGVNAALTAAKATMDAIKTDAQLTAAEQAKALADAKSAAITALNNYKNASDYRDAQKTELSNAISNGTTAINAATTVESVNAALTAAKNAIDAIKTDAQLTAEEKDAALAAAKNNAISALNSYKDTGDYRDAQKTELTNAINNGIAAINAATTVEDVNAALTAAKAVIDAIKTDAQLTAEEQAKALADAKSAAISALNSYKDAGDYRDAQKTELTNAINNGIAAINAAMTVEDVNAALDASKKAIDAIKTDAQLTAEEKDAALAAAKKEAISALDSYKDAGDYRDAQKAELTNGINKGIADINAAVSVEAVNSALEAAKTKLDAIKTDAQLTKEEQEAASAADKEVANKVSALIDAIGTVTYTDASKEAIEAARKAYDALTPAQKELVAVYEKLLQAEKTYADLKAEAEKPKYFYYTVIEGANQTREIGSMADLTIKIDAEHHKLVKVTVNGKEIRRGTDYTDRSGSTIITFKSSYLNALVPGTYAIKAYFADGEASTTFVIKQVAVPVIPQTGDNSLIHLSLLLLALSVIGLYAAAKKRRI